MSKTIEELNAGVDYLIKAIDELKVDSKEIVEQTKKTNGRVTKNEIAIEKIHTALSIVKFTSTTATGVGIAMIMQFLFA